MLRKLIVGAVVAASVLGISKVPLVEPTKAEAAAKVGPWTAAIYVSQKINGKWTNSRLVIYYTFGGGSQSQLSAWRRAVRNKYDSYQWYRPDLRFTLQEWSRLVTPPPPYL
jgi:hypothetical protein